MNVNLKLKIIDDYKTLLTDKKNAYAEMLSITEAADVVFDNTLTGQALAKDKEKCCANFVSLYEKRRYLFERAQAADERLTGLNIGQSDLDGDTLTLQQEISSLAKRILSIDKQNGENYAFLQAFSREALKGLNAAKTVRNSYNAEDNYPDTGRFDSKS
ncbi:hypothetical protein FACS189490_02850 [Clostridia bacterium]|nr:hypothetical protein FACS189490_02850 [Clostridia bacterium]